jgi:N-hydroxyarylamine O-acetyltransferase
VTEDDHFTLQERQDDDSWQAQYQFNLQAYQYADYAERCHYHQSSPESHFKQRRVCTRATPEGRLTLSELRFITTTLSGEQREQLLPNEEEFGKMLAKHFGIIRQ